MGHWESAGLPEDFDGSVRLFPLPNLVLFPHVIQALHIFEPRYCDMLSEARESDHLIAMALLIPGWEHDYQGKPKIGQTVCIGKIISHTPTSDGRHNILLAGIQRARLLEELVTSTTFRQARVEICQDELPHDFALRSDQCRKQLLDVFRSVIPIDAANSKTFTDLLTQQLPIGMLTDIIAYAVNLPGPIKQLLLSEVNVEHRFEILMQHLGPLATPENETQPDVESQSTLPSKQFPPPFSEN
jgi:uncharacterized protein